MARAFFRIIGRVGTGTTDDPIRPRWLGSYSGITGWACCYGREGALLDRQIVLVEADESTLGALAKRLGVLRLSSLAALRSDTELGPLRTVIRDYLRQYSGSVLAEWHDIMVGDYRTGD